jgi:hypothetical protein
MKSTLGHSSYLTGAEARQKLIEIERKYDLFKYTVGGFSAWRILRFEVMSNVQNLPFFSKTKETSRIRRLIERLSLVRQELPRLLFPKQAKYIVKTFTSALRETEMDMYKDVYFDDLIRVLDSWYKIEALNNPEYNYRRSKMLFPAEITTAAIDLFASVMSYLGGPRSITTFTAVLLQIIRAEPELQSLSPGMIRNKLRWFYWSKRIYSILLRKIKPRYVLTADTGEFPIWAAAQELGITTIEFQHGIFSRDHPDSLPDFALIYKNSLIVPDKLLVYGQYWVDELKGNRFYDRELIPVGNLNIEHYRELKLKRMMSNGESSRCTILFTTQGLDRERLIEFVVQFALIAKASMTCQIFIKLHPAENDRKIYEHSLSAFPNVQILFTHEEPTTYDLLTRSHYHCSIASATHYDALGVGVQTIVLPLAGHEVVAGLVSSGHAVLAKNPRDLADIVSNFQNAVVPPETSDYYFSTDALKNMINQIG